MPLNRTTAPLKNANDDASLDDINVVLAGMNDLKTNAADKTDGKFSSDDIEISEGSDTAGDRGIKFWLTASNWVRLFWDNASLAFKFVNQAGALKPVAFADGTAPTHGATFGQLDAAMSALVIPAAASKTEIEAGSITNAYVAPGRQQYHPSAAKAWARIDQNGTQTILSSYNVTSISDGGTGITNINWTTPFASTAYAVFGTATAGCIVNNNTANQTTSGIRVNCFTHAGNPDDVDMSVLTFGGQ